jgi:hypothetical protein
MPKALTIALRVSRVILVLTTIWRLLVLITHPAIILSRGYRRPGQPPPQGAAKSSPITTLATGMLMASVLAPRSSRGIPVHILAQLIEQCLRAPEVLCSETLGEPAVDGGEKGMGFGAEPLIVGEAGEACSGAQFPELGLLLLGNR